MRKHDCPIGHELRVASGRNLYKNTIYSSQNHPSFDSLPPWREEKNICTELWDFYSTVKESLGGLNLQGSL